MRYFVGLGSNIEPQRHLPLMIRALAEFSPVLHIGRVMQTSPLGVVGEKFLNVPVCMESEQSPQQLKLAFNEIEASLGRDRSDPLRKIKSRTADLDILLSLEESQTHLSPDMIPNEPYMLPMLLELLGLLKLIPTATRPLPPGIVLSLDGLSIGREPVTLTWSGAGLRLDSIPCEFTLAK